MKTPKEITRDIIHYILPKNCFGDYLFGLYSFVVANGYYPSVKYPRRFMEHMLRMKRSGELYDPLRQLTSDKHRLKQFVAATVGARYSAETHHLLRTEAEVEALRLTAFPCVIKPTHSSGDVVIVRSAADPIDRKAIARWLKIDLYRQYREANYRYLRPAVMVEAMIGDGKGGIAKDYKVYCIDGAPKFVQVDTDRLGNHVRNYYNTEWEHLPFTSEVCPIGPAERRPAALDEMLGVARRLAAYFPGYVRVDLLHAGTEIKVTELDHSTANCKMRPRPIEYDDMIGALFADPQRRLRPVAAERARDNAGGGAIEPALPLRARAAR